MVRNILNIVSISLIYYISLLAISGCTDRNKYSQSATPNPINPNTYTPDSVITNTPTPTPNTTSASANPTLASTLAPTPTKPRPTFSQPEQLTIQKSFLARKTKDGKVIPVGNVKFTRGEDIYFILGNVGKFQKGSDGKHWIDLDIFLKNHRGKIISSKENMLGEKGNTFLKNDVAISPYGTVNTTKTMSPGRYNITLIVHDKISKAKKSATKTLILQ